MSTEMVTDVMKEGLFVVLKTAAPPLIVSLVIGLATVSYTHLRAHETSV